MADVQNDDHDEQLIKRYGELAGRAERTGAYAYSDFHSPSGAALAYHVGGEGFVRLWGGQETSERVMVRFGNPEEMGYDEDFPIVLIRIAPIQPKFADRLGHRDFLGAIMNLGIERDVIGDVLVADNSAYVFACDRIAEFVRTELTQVKHTPVRCEIMDEVPADDRRVPAVLHDVGQDLVILGQDEIADGDRAHEVLAVVYDVAGVDGLRVGAVAPDMVGAEMRDCDVIVLPSRYDAWGVALVEGAQQGLAMIASDAVGASELIGDNPKCGFVVKSCDAGALASAMLYYAQDPSMAGKHGKNAMLAASVADANNLALRMSAILDGKDF